MEVNSKERVIIGLLIINFVAILWMGWNLNGRIDRVERNISSNLSNIQNELWQMDGRIELSVERLLREERNLVKSLGYDITKVDTDSMTAYVELKVDLKEKNSGTDIYCLYEGASEAYEMILMKAQEPL